MILPLIALDQQLHALAQPIAKLNRALVPFKSDDSHTNLAFVSLSAELRGQLWSTALGTFVLSLALDKARYRCHQQNGTLEFEVAVEGRTLAELEGELAEKLSPLGVNKATLTEEMHYQMPTYPFLAQPLAPFDPTVLAQWLKWRRMANLASFELQQVLELAVTPRIWPHHFDTGVYGVVFNSLGIGFGLAMADTLVDSPYFYLTAYPIEGQVDFDHLAPLPLGYWKVTPHWRGGVLSVEECERKNLSSTQAIAPFLAEGLRALLGRA